MKSNLCLNYEGIDEKRMDKAKERRKNWQNRKMTQKDKKDKER